VIYRTLVRPILFRLDPERSHELALDCLGALGSALSRLRQTPASPDPVLGATVCGLRFPTVVGLAGGFDKAGRALWAWPALGFGFVEVGTVTALPQPGNPRPRVFRFPADEALINRLGFNSPGSEAVASRLAAVRRSGPYPIPVGVNIGKSAIVANEDAVEDHLFSLERLHPYADFLVVNVSSPNTPDLRGLQERSALIPLMEGLSQRNRSLGEKPLFVKVAPDLREPELEEIAGVLTGRAHGIVATNTTVRRNGLWGAARIEAGGLSGRPLRALATQVIRGLWRLTGGRVPIIGVGGVFTAEDAYAKIKAGATLVELYTGFVYGGPGTPRRILAGLRRLLARDGFRTLAQAVGVEAS
jgi:dihydroorotate dehydrogenase